MFPSTHNTTQVFTFDLYPTKLNIINSAQEDGCTVAGCRG